MYEELFRERHQGQRRPKEQGTDRPVSCQILTDAETVEDEVFVFAPQLGTNARRGPARWEPRAVAGGTILLPKEGDQAIMIFDDRGQPWIISWWPYE